MRSFCSLTRNIVLKPKLNPQLTFRTFTATTPHHKYQTPIHKKDKIMSTTTTLKGQPLDRQVLDSMLRRRMFYTPSFEIYNGVAGLVSNRSFIQCSQCFIRFACLDFDDPVTSSYSFKLSVHSRNCFRSNY